MTGTEATRHGMSRIGKNIENIENNKKAGTAEKARKKKTKQKDPKGEAEKAKKKTETKTSTPAKKPYAKERIRIQSIPRFEETKERK